VIIQNPNTFGEIRDLSNLKEITEKNKVFVSCGVDLLSNVIFKPVGEYGFEICWGTTQRFGTPLGYGGPHAGFISTHSKNIRTLPGRIIGRTIDSNGDECFRMTLQTREQHIKKDKATSNICTAQALLANINALYAIYHGKQGLRNIANDIVTKTNNLHHSLKSKYKVLNNT